MAKIKLFYDKKGKVIGFEKLYINIPNQKGKTSIPLEFGSIT